MSNETKMVPTSSLFLTVVRCPDDVALLNWEVGQKDGAFRACHTYIMDESNSWDDRLMVYHLMGVYGIDLPMDVMSTSLEMESYIELGGYDELRCIHHGRE